MDPWTLLPEVSAVAPRIRRDGPGIPSWRDEVAVGVGRAAALSLVQEFIDGENLQTGVASKRWRKPWCSTSWMRGSTTVVTHDWTRFAVHLLPEGKRSHGRIRKSPDGQR